jgi:hypothetical protein
MDVGASDSEMGILRIGQSEGGEARQERPVQLGGFLGRLTLEGDLAPFGPLLRAAELLHFGKGTIFGLGWFTIEVPAGGGS